MGSLNPPPRMVSMALTTLPSSPNPTSPRAPDGVLLVGGGALDGGAPTPRQLHQDPRHLPPASPAEGEEAGRRRLVGEAAAGREPWRWPRAPVAVASRRTAAEEAVYEVVLRQAALVEEATHRRGAGAPRWAEEDAVDWGLLLGDAYHRCGEVCAEYAKTFYLGTQLMTPERRKAVWAIYVWCRRTDELPFKDMIEGMRLDLWKSRYRSFDELYLYCYYVAGTVGLMTVPVMGIAPDSKASTESVYNAALALGIANQLTNILRDVGEDSRRGRIYLPLDELAEAGLTEEDIFRGKVTDKWRKFMKGQILRARLFFDEAEKGVAHLDSASRWPVLASLWLYRQILDAIEANDYNNFTKRAYVNKAKKLLSLPVAYARAAVAS
ncbi:hypothetical protein OsJ_36943 [Oryza sativa Japonica Group]|uniref:15-cis-phytoene synthase n=1 Tax=Oryza sativa subsp. japonica TaxID=39947 RepID=B9GEE2_ORYSJ|nr:hypothetical protein OsJ_36943 [Oryza sativa Japonica Group]